ncbi:twin-arginine translocase TatA/TatE family subunit [Archaeoglobus profundus]|uniref:Sec-independent translocation protein mttA/Hcf106 n=1 Tax=Archaeoglobus profundus (strain DSM 5631 / JCM 9629 / NBRC 100127 / Av18) TaxID=572546 RepID=D2RDG3_ARCPA|nr:twin-arginine translocase TatA/TatE family subunit [Archaeoglobus profundus]ADB58157.1 sec-independent translocation protein mttA/Hcf106 [Archaeoglobus profundus DSM 5631]
MLGWGELAIIVVLAVILLGPDKLADLARTLGRIYGEYQKAKRQLELELLYGYEIPTKEKLEEIAKKKMSEITSDFIKNVETVNNLDKLNKP